MKRLATKVYLAFLAVLLVFFLLTALIFWRAPHGARDRGVLEAAAAVARLALPDDLRAAPDLDERLAGIAAALGGSAHLFTDDGERLARAGGLVPQPRFEAGRSHWLSPPHDRHAPAAALRVGEDHWLVVALPPRRGDPHGFLVLLVVLLLALAVGAYPLARGITGRIEGLTERVDALGRGELGARVEVSGRDEIARLARSFNHASARIEELVGSQRTLLASASHELRSPLARLRVAIELLGDEDTRPEGARLEALQERIVRDIDRLDAGVEELLVVSRLDLQGTEGRSEVDLLAIAAEEAARFGLEAGGESVRVRGDDRSLRHLVRNLLANAERHAGREGLGLRVEARNDQARLVVLDRGPGIPEDEREAVFQPFRRGRGSSGDGIGIGLAIAREIAERHGGSISIEDREGGGSAFRVTLPAAPTSAAASGSGALPG
ncbi:MAG: HAMP domain-containing sensor histidine kinase [Myxococcota bacterium]|nr:HAMP domain-containing sensor histidine kinase [Myxococcota bacterium]